MDQNKEQEKALEAAAEPRQEMHAKTLAGEEEQLRIRGLKAEEKETKIALQAARQACEEQREIVLAGTETAAKAFMEAASIQTYWGRTVEPVADMRLKR